MNARLGLAVVLMALCSGCTAATYQYSVSVKNQMDQPMVVGFAKEGSPFEDIWASPEDLAQRPLPPDEIPWGIPVAPGKEAVVESVKVKLHGGSRAYVRVYTDTQSLSDLLAVSRGSPNRLDILLQPGSNRFVVNRSEGQLVAERVPE